MGYAAEEANNYKNLVMEQSNRIAVLEEEAEQALVNATEETFRKQFKKETRSKKRAS